jgi:8-oxo-dGTP diphosphatase
MPDSLIPVTAAILRDGERILIAQRIAKDGSPGLWEFPGGKIEPGETPEAALARELHEELSIRVTVGACLGRNPWPPIELIAYEVQLLKGVPTPSVHAAVRWVSPREFADFAFMPADIAFCESLALQCGFGS